MRNYVFAGMLALSQVATLASGVVRSGQEGVLRPPISIDGRSPNDSNGEAAAEAARMARIASRERQKRILADTTKMIRLATEVKAAVDGTASNATPPDAIRKTEEIEKLAHDLKQRMSGGA